MAEALMARWGTPRFKSMSAGLAPSTAIDPGAAAALRDELYSPLHSPRLLSDLLATVEGNVDLVIAFDALEGDLDLPGKPPSVRWHVDDPRTHSEGEKDRLRAWRSVLRDLEGRIKLLVSLLPTGFDEFLERQRTKEAGSTTGGRAALGA